MKEKQARWKKWLAFFLIGCLSLHFFLLVTYSFRSQTGSFLSGIAKQYCEPLFIQNFKIFAPDAPAVHYALLLRFKQGDSWSNWSNPTETTERAFRNNRLSSAYYLSVLQQHALRELATAAIQFNQKAKSTYLNPLASKSIHFYRFARYSNYLIRKTKKERGYFQQIQLALRINRLNPNDKQLNATQYIFLPIQSTQP